MEIIAAEVNSSGDANGNIKVQMFNMNTAASTNGIAPKFKVFNTGNTSINLSDVKLRYYYTIDGEKAQNFWCDYAALITGWNYAGITDKVTGTFVKINPSVTGADYYLEIGFKSDAGTLAAGASVENQVRFAKSDWTNYNQADDYSFNSSASQLVDWDKVTVYVGTTQVWGIDPTGNNPGPVVTDSTITPATVIFDKNLEKQADIQVTMTLNGNTFVSIKNGTAALTQGTDYTVANNVVTIQKSYLATLAVGSAVLIFNFSAGNAQTLTITVSDSTPAPSSLELSVGSASVNVGASVTIPVTFKGVPTGYVDNCDFQLSYDTSIFETVDVAAGEITVNPTVNFSSNVDSTNGVIYVLYTDSKQDGTEAVKQDGVFAQITLKVKSTAAAGTTEIKVKSLGGFTDKDLNTIPVKATNGVVTIAGTTPGPIVTDSTITPATAAFDKNVSKQADIAVTMTLNGNTFVSIKNGTVALTQGTDYTVTNNVVTINKSYLATLAVGSAGLTFKFSAGNAQTLTITVSDSTVVVKDSTITPTTAVFDKNVSKQADIAVTMTLNGNTFVSIKNGTAALTQGTDYTVTNNVVTINKSYLTALAVGSAALTFNFSAGNAQTLTVTVSDSTVVDTTFGVNVAAVDATAGGTVVVPVSFKNVPSKGINNCDFKLSYDLNVLTVSSISAGEIVVDAALNFSSAVNAGGVISMLFMDNTQLGKELITKDGTFATITFKVAANAATGVSAISQKGTSNFADYDLNSIKVVFTNGSINVK